MSQGNGRSRRQCWHQFAGFLQIQSRRNANEPFQQLAISITTKSTRSASVGALLAAPGLDSTRAQQTSYFALNSTSPCAKITSFSDSRYLKDPAASPARAGPLTSRTPGGA